MDQHPIPRQITTFEFKLIGFLTIRQFIYLVVFIPLAYIALALFPIPILNILLAIIVGLIGIALAFVPVNDRPLEIWLRNLFKRLTSPTQYLYRKQNPPIYFLKNLFFLNDPHRILTHVESQEKLAKYLALTAQPQAGNKKQTIDDLLKNPHLESVSQTPSQTNQSQSPQPVTPTTPPQTSVLIEDKKKPFLAGVIKNHKSIPLPGIMVYVKDEKNQVLRLLKTNPHGIFATFNPLPLKEYSFEIRDPKNLYFFDTMKIKVEIVNPKPLEFFSKELL